MWCLYNKYYKIFMIIIISCVYNVMCINYYISPYGEDNGNCSINACKSISYTFNQALVSNAANVLFDSNNYHVCDDNIGTNGILINKDIIITTYNVTDNNNNMAHIDCQNHSGSLFTFTDVNVNISNVNIINGNNTNNQMIHISFSSSASTCDVSFNQVRFMNNAAEALHIEVSTTSSCNILLSSTHFENTTSANTFTMKYLTQVTGGKFGLYDCTFIGNNNKLNTLNMIGSSIFHNIIVELTRVRFLDNLSHAWWFDLMILVYWGIRNVNMYISNCEFKNNGGSALSARFYILHSTTVLFEDCIFESEDKTSHLLNFRHVLSHYSAYKIHRCTFNGGAQGIFAHYQHGNTMNGQIHEVINSTFTQQSENSVYIWSNKVLGHAQSAEKPVTNTFFNCSFSNNTAPLGGAAIRLLNPNDVIEANENKQVYPFTGNFFATLFDYKSQTSIESCTFTNNVAASYSPVGGALALLNGEIFIKKSTFLQNTASQLGGGEGTATVHFSDTVFDNNKANRGAHFYSDSIGYMNIEHSRIISSEKFTNHITLWSVTRASNATYNQNTIFQCPQGYVMSHVASNFMRLLELKYNGITTLQYQQTGAVTIETVCSTCEAPLYSLGQQSLEPGVSDIPLGLNCQECPFGITCYGGSNISVNPNIYAIVLTNSNTIITYTCPPNYCHPSEHAISDSQCHLNRDGRLCGSCKDGYSHSIGSSNCIDNNECNDGWYFFLLVIIMSSGFVIYLLKRPISEKGLLKVTLIFYQILPQLMETPDNAYNTLMNLFNFKLSSNQLCPIENLTTVGSLATGFFAPLFMMPVAIAAWLIPTKMITREHLEAMTLRIVLFTYSTITSTTFVLLNCIQLSDEYGNESLYLYKAADIKCYTAWQILLIIVAILLCCLPLLIFYITFYRNDKKTTTVYTVLTAAYSEKSQFWEAILYGQVLIINAVSVSIQDRITKNIVNIVMIVLFANLQTFLKPFRSADVNILQCLCLFSWSMIVLLEFPQSAVVSMAASIEQAEQMNIKTAEDWQKVFILLPLIAVAITFIINFTKHQILEQSNPSQQASSTEKQIKRNTILTTLPKRASIIDPPKIQMSSSNQSIWVCYTDEQSGCSYYHNEQSNETTWDRPEGENIVVLNESTTNI